MPKTQKSSKIEKERRIKIVLAWILADALEHEIIEQCSLDFNVKERMAWYYIKEARKRVWDIEKEDLEQSIEIAVAQRKKLIRSMSKQFRDTPQGIRTILQIQDSISKLKGQFVEKVAQTDASGKDITPIDLSKLSDEELRMLVELQRKSGISQAQL